MPVMESQLPKIIVIGAGPVGLSLGLGLAQNGFRVQVVEAGSDPRKRAGPRPARSTALMPLSQETLARLGVWERVADKGAPLHKLRLIDDQADRWTNPVIEVFSAEELTSTPFGHNVVNADLVDALLERAAEWGEAAVELLFDAPVTGWAPGQVTLGDGVVLEADDPRRCRAALDPALAGIGLQDYRPDRVALVCQIEHSIDHEGISTEFHRREGPLTTVPMPATAAGQPQSAIVWVHRPARAEALRALDDDAFARALQSALRGVLGEITSLRARGGFEVGTQVAERFDGPQLALVGETAHVMPPIGAQGLNTSLADVAVLLSLLDHPSRLQDPDMLRSYSARRRGDVITRLTATHFLNQAIQSHRFGLDHARRGALKSLGWLRPMRHGLMRAGMRPFGVG